MKYKIVVRHLGGHTSVYKFPRDAKWGDHFVMYRDDVASGFYQWVELWKRTAAVATGEPGEELWDLVERFPRRVDNVLS